MQIAKMDKEIDEPKDFDNIILKQQRFVKRSKTMEVESIDSDSADSHLSSGPDETIATEKRESDIMLEEMQLLTSQQQQMSPVYDSYKPKSKKSSSPHKVKKNNYVQKASDYKQFLLPRQKLNALTTLTISGKNDQQKMQFMGISGARKF